jgi:hypothetical protein
MLAENSSENSMYGIGDANARFRVCIQNRPNYHPFDLCQFVLPASQGVIGQIGNTCGNGWRKVFNVYAKLVFALGQSSLDLIKGSSSWQAYRDHHLLTLNSNTALLFSTPDNVTSDQITIVMGKHYGKSLSLPFEVTWLDDYFAINTTHKFIICPYFDYRQLSNIKIIRLTELIESFS